MRDKNTNDEKKFIFIANISIFKTLAEKMTVKNQLIILG
ncbi:hypothetical protein J3D55_002257 [Chryseobacterium ginsenosidimutans]|jgi:hypothetical protein|nr:hypothetical protein [Chryseobacterium ginsenosidimutans]